MQIATILDQIDLGAMALPEFQRGYVWSRNQVRELMKSLYRRYPVGSLLVWVTKTESATARGDGKLQEGTVELLLDGQQRITSLYGIIRGQVPKFFDGNKNSFTGLYFHLEDEEFQFYMPTRMRDNPLWVDVTELMQIGLGEAIQRLMKVNGLESSDHTKYINRLTAIDGIKQCELHIEKVTGKDKTVDVVVDIFNRVNTGGTKLSQGDLALAKICAEWPDARMEMKLRLDKWKKAGFSFRLEWLLRNINTITTGEALFSALENIDRANFEIGLKKSEKYIDQLLNLISSRLGLDHDRVLKNPAFPLMVRYLEQRGGKLTNAHERDQLLYWYIHTFLWGRYSGSSESYLNRDLEAIENVTPEDGSDGLDRLIAGLRQDRGDLELSELDFHGATRGSRFYTMLYMMTRICQARDWGTGVELKKHLLGNLSSLQMHHIFPQALLYEHDFGRREVNAIANFTFLTQETNLEVLRQNPEKYIPAYEKKFPGIMASHWIPMDPELWKVENYHEFLAERRRLLADAANTFLDQLLAGQVPDTEEEMSVLDQDQTVIHGGVESEDEEVELLQCIEWLAEQSLAEGELLYELTDEDTGKPLAILDLAWPNGLQEGLSQSVAILLEEGPEVEASASAQGYRFFTSIDRFKQYVNREVLVLEEV